MLSNFKNFNESNKYIPGKDVKNIRDDIESGLIKKDEGFFKATRYGLYDIVQELIDSISSVWVYESLDDCIANARNEMFDFITSLRPVDLSYNNLKFLIISDLYGNEYIKNKLLEDKNVILSLSDYFINNNRINKVDNEGDGVWENVSYEKNKDGTITYRGEEFPGFNKPKKYTGKGKFKKRVLAKEGDQIKVINYGHSDYSDYTKHKDKERRDNFRKRHKCDPVSELSKLTKKYWACQDLW